MIVRQLKQFLSDKDRNRWLESYTMAVYVRKARHILQKDMPICTTLDLATISVHEPYQGRGLCKSLIYKAHELNPFQATYIENAENPILYEALIRWGWTLIDEHFGLNTFYLETGRAG